MGKHSVNQIRKGITAVLVFLYTPIAKGVIKLGNFITPDKGFEWGLFTDENELRDLMDHAHNRGLVESDEHEMIHNVFDLGDTLVRELMVPRTEMVWIEHDKTLRQGLSLALRSGYSRIPVAGDDLDNIIGLAYGGTNKNLVSVGASGGVVFKDGTGLSITAAGTNGQILQANASGAPTWVKPTYGNSFTTSTQASYGKRTTRSKTCSWHLCAAAYRGNADAGARATRSSKPLETS